MWKHLTKSKDNEKMKSKHPKITYLFEYLADSSKIDEKETSKAYFGLESIQDFNSISRVFVLFLLIM